MITIKLNIAVQVIKMKYPGAVSSKSVKDKEMERKAELKRKPGEKGNMVSPCIHANNIH